MQSKITAIILAVLIFLTGTGFIGQPRYEFTEREEELLMLLADAEAGNQGVLGEALIMYVVINRWKHGGYGNDIESVIFAEGQFYTGGMGTTPSELAKRALYLVEHGWDNSQGALYFCADGYNGPVPLFKYRDHYFSRKEPINNVGCYQQDRLIREEIS